jgi:hypothetical protein
MQFYDAHDELDAEVSKMAVQQPGEWMVATPLSGH